MTQEMASRVRCRTMNSRRHDAGIPERALQRFCPALAGDAIDRARTRTGADRSGAHLARGLAADADRSWRGRQDQLGARGRARSARAIHGSRALRAARAGADLHAELAQARWGLVPNEFSSPREADRYELWTNRAERLRFSRNVYKAFLETRCLVPVELGSLEGTTVMRSDGTVLTALETLAMCSKTVLLAGIWTRFERPRLRLESYSIITRLHDVAQGLRSVIMLSSNEARLWLNPDSSEKDLEVVVGSRTQASRRQARGDSLSRRSAQMVAPGLLV